MVKRYKFRNIDASLVTDSIGGVSTIRVETTHCEPGVVIYRAKDALHLLKDKCSVRRTALDTFNVSMDDCNIEVTVYYDDTNDAFAINFVKTSQNGEYYTHGLYTVAKNEMTKVKTIIDHGVVSIISDNQIKKEG